MVTVNKSAGIKSSQSCQKPSDRPEASTVSEPSSTKPQHPRQKKQYQRVPQNMVQ